MAVFGILFVIIGVLFLMSPILPGNKIENRIDLTIAILIGIYFVLYGAKEMVGIEDQPLTDAIAVAFVVAVFGLLGYSFYKG
jgi:uncharacterized membrane protein